MVRAGIFFGVVGIADITVDLGTEHVVDGLTGLVTTVSVVQLTEFPGLTLHEGIDHHQVFQILRISLSHIVESSTMTQSVT
jgi:hypothetical protein